MATAPSEFSYYFSCGNYDSLRMMCHYRLQECTSGDAETPHGMSTKSDTSTHKNLLRPHLDDRSVGANTEEPVSSTSGRQECWCMAHVEPEWLRYHTTIKSLRQMPKRQKGGTPSSQECMTGDRMLFSIFVVRSEPNLNGKPG